MPIIVHRLAKLNWVDVVLSPLTVLLMEVLWVYPWLAWTGEWHKLGWQRPPLTLISLILLISVSFLVTRFFLSRRWPLWWIRLGVLSCGLVVILIVVRVEYGAGFGLLSGQWFAHTAQIFVGKFLRPHPMGVALAAAVYLWWRGISLGRSPFYFSNVYRTFLLGLTALVILIIVWGASLGVGSLASLASTVGLHVAGFFFFGLTAMALGNLQSIRRKMLQEEVAPISSRRWLPILLGVVGGIVLVGMGIASIFSAQFVALLAQLISLTFNLLRQALNYMLIPFAYLAQGLFYAMEFIMNLLRREQVPIPTPSENFTLPVGTPEGGTPLTFSADAIVATKWALFAVIAIVVLFLLARMVRRLGHVWAEAEVEEIHESLWSWSGFKADLRLFFSMIWQRFARKRKEPVPVSAVPGWYTGEDVQGMLSIRQVYRHLLWEASCARMARWRHETPYEYARRLGQAVPDSSEPLSELTNLYINVRYGDLAAESKQVDYANSLWKILQRLLSRVAGNQQVE